MTREPATRSRSSSSLTRSIAFQPLYTASTWPTLIQTTAAVAAKANGLEGKMPRLSNRDAIALLMAWRAAARPTPGATALWYQYAAAAYGWEAAGDALQVDDERAAQRYPTKFLPSLWAQLADVANALEDTRTAKPELAPLDVWADPDTLGAINTALAGDGMSATIKIPVPGACVDPKTGKTVLPRLKCEFYPGTVVPKKCTLECEPLMIDDPITAIGKRVGKAALILGGIYLGVRVLERVLVARAKRPRRRTRTRTIVRRRGIRYAA